MEVEKLQRYDLLERIAAGGMGEIYRARAVGPHGFEKTLAVKRILPELASDEEFVERFVRECKLSVSLSHANIVQVFDLGRAQNDLFLVMEYVHGTDLARLLSAFRSAGRSVPLALALHIVSEAAQGLAYAHERYDLPARPQGEPEGVIHCDISPSNLLLSYAGEVKITDFGVAQVIDHSRRSPSEPLVMGKFRYMAPEQIRGQEVDARTDLYALGVVLYEVLTGRKAFAGDDTRSTCDQVLAGEVVPASTYRPDIPEALEALLRRTMSVDPAQRPQDARELISSLAEISRTLDKVTALDLAALVREMVPPPPEERSASKLGVSRHDRTAASPRATSSYVALESTNSEAVTQWIASAAPARSAPGTQVWEMRGGGLRVSRVLPAVLMLLLLALLGGLAAGLKLRPAGDEGLAASAPARDGGPEGEGEGEEPGPAARPQKEAPVEAIPRELDRILAAPEPAPPSRPDMGREEPRSRKVGGQPGYLDIYVEPWANVILDGRALNKPTPLFKVPVRPGPHHLVLSNPILGRRQVVDVDVAPGQVHKVEVYLVEK